MRTVPLVKQKGKENQNHRGFIYYILQDPPESINGEKILANYPYNPLPSFSLAEVTNLQAMKVLQSLFFFFAIPNWELKINPTCGD